MIPCFFLTPTDRQALYLRRYARWGQINRACDFSYHNTKREIGETPVTFTPEGYIECVDSLTPDHNDDRWPTHCACGYAYESDDEWQLLPRQLYTRSDNGQETTLDEAGPGGLYYATWLENDRFPKGPDGRILMCITPGGTWNIDSRASNCTLPHDDTHRCWVRHGNPEDPHGTITGQPLHVDKNGPTCQAGAGSILCGTYHGFLHGGFLTSA